MRSLSRLRRLLAAILCAVSLLGSAGAARALDYEPGRGLSLFGGRLTIGGYLALDLSFLDESDDQLVLDDLSTFVTLRLSDNWLLFSEAEIEESVHLDGDGVDVGHDVFSLERLYAQWQPGDHFRLRAGKMLTPIGIWNPIHAQPLVWTTSRPITTEHFFDTGVTGAEASVFQTFGAADLEFTLFGQATDHLNDSNDLNEAHRSIGGRLEGGLASGAHVGASFVRFRDHSDGRNETTYALDALWPGRLVEVWAEGAVNDPDSGRTTLGAYVQVVVHASPRLGLHPFVRVEYVDLETVDRVPVVFGLAWRPTATTVFKVEGIVGAGETELGGDGVLSSFSVLF